MSGLYLYNAPGVGASLIAGLGQAWGVALNVEIEAAPGLGLDNHSMVRLTDKAMNENNWRLSA